MKEAYHPYGRVVMYVCMNHVTQTCERVMAHLLIFFIIAAAAPASMKLSFKNVFEKNVDLCRGISSVYTRQLHTNECVNAHILIYLRIDSFTHVDES
jgi:hypothetical protein